MHVCQIHAETIYLLGGNVMSFWLERDSSKSQVFGGGLRMLLDSVSLNFLVIAGNLSPITVF